ncbi:hypothetical protein DM860_013455 [Cuscuta australis]|uniref:Uncharacterized protein n=1 Tax=Cuscuta australis TaxID=267555 RepID=A0A328CZW8_9ASTE|nr:hypothetical protein DM860_013455 [Cuscuta australis]
MCATEMNAMRAPERERDGAPQRWAIPGLESTQAVEPLDMVIQELILEAHNMIRASIEYLVHVGSRWEDRKFKDVRRGRVGVPLPLEPPPPIVPTSLRSSQSLLQISTL